MPHEILSPLSPMQRMPNIGDEGDVLSSGSPFAGLLLSSGVGLVTLLLAIWCIHQFL